ncbi:hypothetical protein VTK73DRAFT_5500 [Phialemonium thermophilum]|uniref:Secreted protein n=1 Tax=Phialemonium thermophilum TaxID=223376 RepID=A0ABR3V1I5_9PEZI
MPFLVSFPIFSTSCHLSTCYKKAGPLTRVILLPRLHFNLSVANALSHRSRRHIETTSTPPHSHADPHRHA